MLKKHGLGGEKQCFYLSNSMVFEKHDFNEKYSFFAFCCLGRPPCHDLIDSTNGFSCFSRPVKTPKSEKNIKIEIATLAKCCFT